MLDVVIIGGGPVGLYTAGLCEKMGYDVAVLEEDNEIGKPLRCSGLVSRNVRKFFPGIDGWNVIENRIDAAILHSKRSEIVLRKAKAAYVINRTLFDRRISEMVESEIMLGRRAEKISVGDDFVEVATRKGVLRGRMAVLCDGPRTMLARRRNAVKGLMAIVDRPDGSNGVDLYFDKKILRDGFFWKIPRGETTEYGAWGRDVKFADIEKYFGISEYEKFAGLIPVGPVKKSYGRRMLMVGSSAGQVKPWSGGGVVYGLTCAEIAAKAIEKSFGANDFSEDALKEYETRWKGKIGKQIKMGMLFRKFLEHSNDFQLDVAFRTGRMLSYGWMDMDFIV